MVEQLSFALVFAVSPLSIPSGDLVPIAAKANERASELLGISLAWRADS